MIVQESGTVPNTKAYYVTTTRCRDINIRNVGHGYWACVRFLVTGVCNSDKWIPPDGAWRTIATNVKDNTRYVVEIYSGRANYVSGWVAG